MTASCNKNVLFKVIQSAAGRLLPPKHPRERLRVFQCEVNLTLKRTVEVWFIKRDISCLYYCRVYIICVCVMWIYYNILLPIIHLFFTCWRYNARLKEYETLCSLWWCSDDKLMIYWISNNCEITVLYILCIAVYFMDRMDRYVTILM